jgi:transcriptional regulator with XRE-family HTH domain
MSEEASDRRARLLAESALGRFQQKDVARLEGVSDAAISKWKRDNWIAVEDALYELRRAA